MERTLSFGLLNDVILLYALNDKIESELEELEKRLYKKFRQELYEERRKFLPEAEKLNAFRLEVEKRIEEEIGLKIKGHHAINLQTGEIFDARELK